MEVEKGKSSRQPLAVKAGPIGKLSPRERLMVFRSRFEMYCGKNLIDPDSDNSADTMEVNPELRAALTLEFEEVPDRIQPVEFQLDCDEYDFKASCGHILIASGDKLLAYLRVIGEVDGNPLPARKIYQEEIEAVAGDETAGQSIAEISRLLLLGSLHSGPSDALVGEAQLDLQRRLGERLFQLTEKFVVRRGIRHLFAQVHPSHGLMYSGLDLLTQVGPEKLCPGVNDAPAVLMHRLVNG